MKTELKFSGLQLVIIQLGGAFRLGWKTILRMFSPPLDRRELLRQLDRIGVGSLNLTNITALFTGMVLAVQSAYTLSKFGARLYIGEIVTISLVRELGPVLTALMVGGRVGAGITAELGSMTVTEQVDALRSMAADPIRKLVVPRTWATLIMLPLLTVLADTLGIIGGMLIAVFQEGLSANFYFARVFRTLEMNDIILGLSKPVIFAFIIAIIGCHNGLNARGGADGVGRATTNTVYAASIAILIADFFFTKLIIGLLP